MSALDQFENDREQQAVGPDYVEDGLGRDALDVLLENASIRMAQLRASRDTAAVKRSNELTKTLLGIAALAAPPDLG